MNLKTRLSLFSSGSNAQGHLGNGTLDDSHVFQRCSFLEHAPYTLPSGTSRVIDIAAGANHTLILLESEGRRDLWGCGDSRKGQLGRVYQQPSTRFRRLELALDEADLDGFRVKFISATWETSYVVLSCDGKRDIVLSMGSDDYGDLGIGGLKQGQPAKDFHIVRFDHISALSDGLDVLGIYSGQRHVILLVKSTPASSPILVGWGACRHGQLGETAVTPFASVPQVISTPSANIISLALGIHHTVILDDSRNLTCLGSNRKGQLDIAQIITVDHNKIQDVGCTWNGTYVVTEGEERWTVYSSGSNSHQQLGWKNDERDKKTDITPHPVGQVRFPDALDRQGLPPKIVCGSEHALLLVPSRSGTSTSPQLWGWGWNEHGNLGIGHTEDVPVPIQIWTPPESGRIVDVWAGLGTSWVCVEENEP